METVPTLTQSEHAKPKMMMRQGGGGDAVYGIGMFGAWAYYIGRAKTTEERIKGFFKGLVWPAFLVYDLYVFLHKD